jgi:hypothetical protein
MSIGDTIWKPPILRAGVENSFGSMGHIRDKLGGCLTIRRQTIRRFDINDNLPTRQSTVSFKTFFIQAALVISGFVIRNFGYSRIRKQRKTANDEGKKDNFSLIYA